MNKTAQALCVFFITLGALFATIANAAEDLYKIEVIAFRNTSEHDSMSDDLKQHKIFFHELQKSKDLLPAKTTLDSPLPYSLLPPQYLTLMPEEKTLDGQKNINILLHLAWVQPITDKKQTQPIHLFGGAAFNQKGDIIPGIGSNIYQTPPIAKKNNLIWELNGFTKVSQNYSFAVSTDFVLSIADRTTQSIQQYFLNQTQNMQLHELHYFDHPFFGMIIKITPFNFQDQDDNDSDADDN